MSDAPQSASPQKESPSPESKSPTKADIDMKKEKKKKEKALMQFLSKPQNDVIEVPRRAEQQQPSNLSEATNCKICGQLSQKRRQCQFCKEVVCSDHIRKKRKHDTTKKFVRICDDCQDKYLYDKYMKIQNKADEALIMQEMIVQAKHDELSELVSSKQTKIVVLKAKKAELEEQKKNQDHKNKVEENDISNKERRFQHKIAEITAIEEEVKKLEETLPRPLDDDYNCLVDQNNKINKQLLKYEKLASEALKAKSAREKELIEAYEKWEKKETVKSQLKKKEDCCVY